MNKHLTSVLAVLCVTLAPVFPAHAVDYQVQRLNENHGELMSWAAINNAGEIAGAFVFANGQSSATHAALWTDSNPIDLGSLGGGVRDYSQAYGLNDVGQVVGEAEQGTTMYATVWNGRVATRLDSRPSRAHAINDAGRAVGVANYGVGGRGSARATAWDDGVATDLGTLGGVISGALDVNEAGQAVGWSTREGSDARRATLWNGDRPIDLGTLGGPSSQAYGINDSGQIAGGATVPGDSLERAVVWQLDGAVTALDVLSGSRGAVASSINNLGQVVGGSLVGNETRATLWEDGAAIDLNQFLDPELAQAGWTLMQGIDINDRGQIIAFAYNLGLQDQVPVLLVPVPEPAVHAMLLAGAVWLGWVSRRRNRPAGGTRTSG